ncbi:CRISPR system Cascade subunit CasE [Actinobaculum suis]|uniref:CRISPR system Cascade subunit CasE n=1 Tax=Actinobaculum suis TaxID=1657 RepID=A0A1G6ZZQ2_9ACTO|nr:type I-E CRISPR-associated protein Cas6/Cse3/CasE [Actinobaculum suis]MDY5152748.1 type I-E CRISPR-associated protein Cas6/Cse3/CasE [Actinobaculum suis]SDE08154.1 CRISPR system Cascade subunit CasE [Actinobaculum suis]
MSERVYLAKYPLHEALAQEAEHKPQNGWNPNDPKFRHRAVMSLFGDLTDSETEADAQSGTSARRAAAGVLFRVDKLPGQPPFFLVQAQLRPEERQGLEVKQIELSEYPVGQVLGFRIAINAIRRQKGPESYTRSGKKRGGTKAVPVPFDGDTEAPEGISRMTPWLESRFVGALTGVEIINHQREVLGTDRAGRNLRGGSGRVVQVDTVDGVARVADPEQLLQLQLQGIGRAKSYGCGLLTVRPLA